MGVVSDVERFGLRIWLWLTPPPVGARPEQTRHWQVKVVYSLLFLFAVQCGHMVVSETLPWQGGTAKADQLEDVQAKLDALLTQQTKNYRLSLGQEICRIFFLRMDPNSQAVDDVLAESYDQKQAEYQTINDGARYNVTECQRPDDRPPR
jgi:hypothetical protein